MSDVRIKDRVSSYIARHSLLDSSGKHLVAVSGGADSVALLLLLADMNYSVEAVHCNFHLRGAEADRDEAFVRGLCERKGIAFHTVHFDTREYASLHKVSIEMAARNLRYAYFEQLRKDIGAADICVAHHRDDNVETVLMNLVRGTGIHGLSGIRPRNGRIVRPLLCVSRREIEAYLASVGQDYVTDSTNLIADCVRNKFRLNIIPALEEINPAASENICRAAEYVGDAVKVFDVAVKAAAARVAEQTEKGVVINLRALNAEPSPECIAYEILKEYGFSSVQVAQIGLENAAVRQGKTFSAADYDLLVDRKRIIVERRDKGFRTLKIPEPGTYVVADGVRLRLSRVAIDGGFVLSRSRDTVCLDASKVTFPLLLRRVEPGDRFVPFGMTGSRLVSDYLTDRKKTLFQKRSQLVLADALGRIVWLVNERPDNRCRISDKSLTVLVVEYSPTRQEPQG